MRPTPEQQLAGFIAKFAPDVAALIRGARRKMRERLPGAVELVYDNYNFFVIGYGPSEKASEAILSLAAQAKGVSLCFLQGASLPDPKGLLRGSGNVVRNIRLETAATRPGRRAGADEDGARTGEHPDRSEGRAPTDHQVRVRQAAAPPSGAGSPRSRR